MSKQQREPVVIKSSHPYFDGAVKRHVTISHQDDDYFDMAYILTTPPAGVSSSGERILLVHGYLTPALGWAAVAQELAKKGHEVLTFDHAGVGHSTYPEKAAWRFTTVDMANHVAQLVEHVWGSAPFHLGGQSLGGMISQELAHAILIQTPHRILSITLTNTSAGGKWNLLPPLFGIWSIWKGMYQGLTGVPMAHRARYTTCPLIFHPEWLKAVADKDTGETNEDRASKILESLWECHPVPSGAANIAHQAAAVTHDMQVERLEEIKWLMKGPILVICGDEDHLVRTWNSHYIADMLGAELLQITKCGHSLPFQESVNVAEAMHRQVEESAIRAQAAASNARQGNSDYAHTPKASRSRSRISTLNDMNRSE